MADEIILHDWKKTGYTNPFRTSCECPLCRSFQKSLDIAAERLAKKIDDEIMKEYKESNGETNSSNSS